MAGYDDGKDPRQPVGVGSSDYDADSDGPVEGLRVGVVGEGFGHDELSDPELDATVRATAHRLCEAGMVVEEVSIPWHLHGLAIWNVVATDGATAQMIDGNSYGYNASGWYDPALMAHYGRQRFVRADDLSVTTKLAALGGGHSIAATHGRYYAMARRSGHQHRPGPGDDREHLPHQLHRTPGDQRAGWNGARAAHRAHDRRQAFQDATCLKVAKTVEAQVGGFPRPPTSPHAMLDG